MPDLSNVQENNEQVLIDIQTLQTMEQQLFSSLESNPNLTSQQQQQIITKMNQLSEMRINLYKTLSGVNNFYKNALQSSQGTLTDQIIAVSIVEDELNKSKKQLDALEIDKSNKLRLVEINDYYGEKYSEHAKLMKIVIFTLLPILILAIIHNKGFIPNIIYYIFVSIILIIGALYFWYTFSSIVTRDNMNYQEYDWYFNPSDAPTGKTTGKDPWANNGLLGTCVGQNCCSSGQTYSSVLNQCVGNSTVSNTSQTTGSSSIATGSSSIATGSSSIATSPNNNTVSSSNITETFINQVLTKGSNKYKSDVILNSDTRVQPYYEKSFINF